LVLMLVTFIQPETGLFGVTDAGGLRYRAVALAAACWFFVFAVPVLAFTPNLTARGGAGDAADASKRGPVRAAVEFFVDYKRLILRIIRLWKVDRRTLHFLVASAVFRD